ncbi:Hpt domain-containing protein [Bradyrhizobium sp. LLZ17]|uniref:Hpt domain-containing protein n=1 Tax=Bradyrhizobium sp. LLZ17 TaxID=3239388 RepID=A0AB39XBU0_9BRAD
MLDASFAPARSTLETEPLREPGAFEALVREIGQDGAAEVLDVFWSDTSARLELFRTLGLGQHRSKVGREAHSLKSTARTFGYLRLAALALELETTAEALGEAEFCDLLNRMDAAYAAARKQEPQD